MQTQLQVAPHQFFKAGYATATSPQSFQESLMLKVQNFNVSGNYFTWDRLSVDARARLQAMTQPMWVYFYGIDPTNPF